MSFVRAVPEFLGTSANTLIGIGSTISNSNAIAAGPTVALSAAAGDQVSAAVAAFFSGHARGYQTLSAQAAQIHNQFVQKLSSGASTYAAAEAANASPMQQLLNATNTSDRAAAGLPPTAIGDGAPGSGANGWPRGNRGVRGSGAALQRGVSGSNLSIGMAGRNSSTGAGESSGNERFGGLLLGNGGGGGTGYGPRFGGTAAAESGRVGDLLGTARRIDQPGRGAQRRGALLLRRVEADSGGEASYATRTGNSGGVGAVAPAKSTLAGRVGFTDPKGWLFSGSCTGGSGGLLSRVAGDAEVSQPSVTSGAGGHGGQSTGAGGTRLGAASQG